MVMEKYNGLLNRKEDIGAEKPNEVRSEVMYKYLLNFFWRNLK